MDRVRFGRALGYGARHAMRSLTQAVEAASAEDPRAAGRASAGRTAAERMAQTQQAVRQAKAQRGRLRGAVMGPVKRFSSVVWLQVTGTFFAVIAAYLSQGLWAHRRDALGVSSTEARTYLVHAGAFALFAYFAVSSFVRARRRERR